MKRHRETGLQSAIGALVAAMVMILASIMPETVRASTGSAAPEIEAQMSLQ